MNNQKRKSTRSVEVKERLPLMLQMSKVLTSSISMEGKATAKDSGGTTRPGGQSGEDANIDFD